MNAVIRNFLSARELGARASIIALLVAAAGSATNAAAQWLERREITTNHRKTGWQ